MTGDVTAAAAYWDSQAATFDDEPDHGLRDESVRRAWSERLQAWLPTPPADIADLGCGTGTLATMLAANGHAVTGVDISAGMLRAARAKADAAGVAVDFHLGDASDPPLEAGSFDVVLVRHVVWSLTDPHAALARWVRLLRPGGRLVLVEGRWQTEGDDDPGPSGRSPWTGGVDAPTLRAAVEPLVAEVAIHDLAGDDRLWGRPVHDERFALVADAW